MWGSCSLISPLLLTPYSLHFWGTSWSSRGGPTSHVLDPRLLYQMATVWRTQDYVSDTIVCSIGASQEAVLAHFLFTLYTADFSHKPPHSHLQKFSDDSAIVSLIRDWDNRGGKTDELVVDIHRHNQSCTQVNFQWTILDWIDPTAATYKKGQSRIHLLRKLWSFGVQWALLINLYDTVVASANFCGVVCWSSSISAAGKQAVGTSLRCFSWLPVGPSLHASTCSLWVRAFTPAISLLRVSAFTPAVSLPRVCPNLHPPSFIWTLKKMELELELLKVAACIIWWQGWKARRWSVAVNLLTKDNVDMICTQKI